jgi:hypothetical protein
VLRMVYEGARQIESYENAQLELQNMIDSSATQNGVLETTTFAMILPSAKKGCRCIAKGRRLERQLSQSGGPNAHGGQM